MCAPLPNLNRAVGARVRARRLALGYSQRDLAKKVHLTFQQVQKYESGINRIDVTRLFDLARALEISPVDLLGLNRRDNEPENTHPVDLETNGRDALALLRAYNNIPIPEVRARVLELVRALGDGLSKSITVL